MAYHFCEPTTTTCDRCGDKTVCQVVEADCADRETGYVDSLVLCDECWLEDEERMARCRDQRS